MKVKDALLKILDAEGDRILSGQELAARLGVSRTAVWKAMQALKADGYRIRATTNRGYLVEDGDVLCPKAVQALLRHENLPVLCFSSLDSTNSRAMKLAVAEGVERALVLADEQTAGRGRKGRAFFSPPRTGLYMSLILRPRTQFSNALLATLAAAVAVCRTIATLTERSPRIKWVNDILLDGRKVCGILTEAVSDFESGTVESLVVGIGVNMTTERAAFPPQIQDTAASLVEDRHGASPQVSRNRLAAEIADRFFDLADNLGDRQLICDYKKRSIVIGREIAFEADGEMRRGHVLDINERGNLVVEERVSPGNVYVLQAGEIEILPAGNWK